MTAGGIRCSLMQISGLSAGPPFRGERDLLFFPSEPRVRIIIIPACSRR